jgi:putative membrane protein
MSTTTWTQAIYFDVDKVEITAEDEAKVTLDYTSPVILPDDIQLETDQSHEKDTITTTIPVVATHSAWLWLAASLGGLLGLMLLVDSYNFIVEQYDNSFILGTVFLFLIVAICGASLTLTWQAIQKIRTLRTVSSLQREGQQLITNNAYGNAKTYLNKIALFYNEDLSFRNRLDRFYISINDSHHDREICALFSKQVMRDIDQQAYQIVTKGSKETALFVMISQIALLDTILTLWRNVRMVKEIATLYGGKPGFFGSMSLMFNVIQNLIYADVSESVADGTAEIVGGSVLSVMSAQIAQGLGAGILTARLGINAMQACRPLPFMEDEKPRLKEIRREVMSSLKGAFETKTSS